MTRHVTAEPLDPRERYSLYRLCDCPTCEGRGQVGRMQYERHPNDPEDVVPIGHKPARCTDCRGEGRIRQEVASCESPEAVGVALVTLAREGEWEECPLGLLDRMGEPGHKWLILPWMPSARNVRDAARTLARSKKSKREKDLERQLEEARSWVYARFGDVDTPTPGREESS